MPLLLVLLAVLACTRPAAAQGPLRYEAFGQDEGLPLPNVLALAQDEAGFLWVGTEGGLVRYDGRAFVPFRSRPDDPASLASDFAHALLATPAGLWVGTYGGGLDRYDPRAERFHHVRFDGSLRERLSRTRVLARAPNGDVWLGAASGFVARVDGAGRVRDLVAPPGTEDGDEVSALLGAGRGCWIGRNSGLYRYANGRQERVGPPGAVFALLRTRAGRTLVGTATGLYALGPDGALARLDAVSEDGLASASPVYALAEGPEGSVWVGSSPGPAVLPPGAAAYRLDGNAADDDAQTAALRSARIRTLFVDRSGTLWVGTELHGLFKRNRPQAAFVGEAVLGHPDVTALLEAPRGVLWVGTYGGLVRFDLARGVAEPVGPRTVAVRGLHRLRDGALLVGTRQHGLFRVDAATRAMAPVAARPGTPAPRQVLSVSTDRQGRPWVATGDEGVCALLVGDARRLACVRDGFPLPAYATYWDRKGRLWVSYWGSGIVRYDPATGALRRYEHLENVPGTLPNNTVTVFQEAPDGTLWMGTYGAGIARYDEASEGFKVVDEREGLPSSIVFGVLPRGPDLWLSTSRGLVRYSPATGAVRTLDRRDGLQGDEFNANAAARLADGRLAFGGTAGLNILSPERIDPAQPAPVRLTALRIRNRPYHGPLGALGRLRLPVRENFVTFEFAALDLTAPSRNRYAFRLDGLEERWSPATATPVAAYTDLRPGTYTFRVRAAGSDGVWRDDALVLPVEIVPPFWQATWFRGLLLVGFVGAVAYAARALATRRLRAQLARLEADRRVQAERVRIARDLHDHVGAQLANVISVADLLRHHAREGDGDEIDRFAQALDHDARETMQQLRRTIWATSSDAVSVLAVFEQLEPYARHLLRFRDRPRLVVRLVEADEALAASERHLRPVQGLHVLRIAQEAIANTLKHADASRLDVTLRLDAGTLDLTVRDDGTYKPPAAHRPSAGADGVGGFGLRGMKARADEMGAAFDAGPHPDGGTFVTVRLRLDPEPPGAVGVRTSGPSRAASDP